MGETTFLNLALLQLTPYLSPVLLSQAFSNFHRLSFPNSTISIPWNLFLSFHLSSASST